jgi:hypothetical protein
MERLERALERLAERADALSAETVIARLEHGLAGGGDAVVVPLPVGGRSVTTPTRRWPGPMIAAAAFLVVLGLGVGLWLGTSLLRDDTASTGSAATPPDSAATTLPATTITSATPTTSTGDAVAAARALIPALERALNDGDLSPLPIRSGATVELSAMGLWFAAPDAEAPVAAGRQQLAAMLAWEHDLGAWFAFSACTEEGAAGTVEITCTVEHGNLLLDRVGTTAHGEFAFRVAQGQITALFDRRSTEEFSEVYGSKWVPFALRDHPDEAERMFTERGHPILTAESAELHLALIEDWADSWGL